MLKNTLDGHLPWGQNTRPRALCIAVAAAFGCLPLAALSNPTGGVAVHGQATFDASKPNTLVVTTQNGAGTNHSAINWQSFSIPAGSTTRINQPSATSMSINRVVTNTPTQIFGTLSSNGKVVLVNQAGIAVGTGAVVDTAGFTASAVGMSDADALAGRQRFDGNGLNNSTGVLSVQGNIIARGGDVVLIAPTIDLAKTAVVESEGGNVILAAGQSVEVTGRGLEGIHLQVQAPSDQAINLGTLKGDAVGIFAGTLKHSGHIQATSATLEGGKVVLKAKVDAYVSDTAKIVATGTRGGSVDVLGNRVAILDESQIDVSGDQAGGTVRVGGDYQGKNTAVQNASMTYVGNQVKINADAATTGNGGKVIVWADDTTRAYGTVSAQGGSQGGNGGFVELSGKQHLDYQGKVSTKAAQGKSGTLLLDPSDIVIANTTSSAISAGTPFQGSSTSSVLGVTNLQAALANGDVIVDASGGTGGSTTGNITVNDPLSWAAHKLTLNTPISGTIALNGNMSSSAGGLALNAGSGGVVQAGGAFLVLDTLEVTSVGDVKMGATVSAVNQVNILAANVTGSGKQFDFKNQGSFSVGAVGGTSGISTNNGNVRIETSDYTSNKIHLTSNLNAGTGNVQIYSGSTSGYVSASDGVLVDAGTTVSGAIVEVRAFHTAASVISNGSLLASSSLNVNGVGGVQLNGNTTGTSSLILAASGGSITGVGVLTAGGLDITNGSGTTNLSGANQVSNITLRTTTGAITLKNNKAVYSLNVENIGDVTVTGSGRMNVGAFGGAGNVSLSSNNGLSATNIYAAGTLSLTSLNNSIQATGTVTAGSATSINAGTGNVTLSTALNNFNSLSVVGGVVNVKDFDAIAVTSASGTDLSFYAGTSLGVTGNVTATSGAVSLTGNSVTLTGAGVSSASTAAGSTVSITSRSGSNTISQGSYISGKSIALNATSTVLDASTLKPGGLGAMGTVTVSGNLTMQGGATLAMDVASASSFDTVSIGGTLNAASGAETVAVTDLSSGSLSGALSGPIITTAGLSGSALVMSGPSKWTLVSSANNWLLTTAASAAPVVKDEVKGDLVTAFLDKLEQAAEAPEDKKKDKDVLLVEGEICKP